MPLISSLQHRKTCNANLVVMRTAASSDTSHRDRSVKGVTQLFILHIIPLTTKLLYTHHSCVFDPFFVFIKPDPKMFALASQKSASRLEQIATLRARGIGNHIDLPQLVVSGDQSAGKSSVLEGLTGLPFPRQDGLCTRFATEILLHHDDSRVTKIEASLIPASGRDRESLQDLTAYKRTLKDLADLPDVISDAGELMGVRGFGKITLGPSFSRDLLKIKISGPVGLHLSIVDLPGIILVPNEEQTEDDVDIVHDLVDQYLKNPRTIILAVVQAGNDIANQGIIRKSREFDVDGERTVGIITKPDLINDGSEKRIALLARNQDTTKLKLGCFLLKTPSPSELDSQIDAKGRESRELSFFQTSPWKEQNLDKDRTGIGALRHFLQKLLDRHIEHELPKVREEIESLAVSVEQKLLRLGAERVELTEMRLFLTRLAMKFHNITTAALSGDYHDTDHGFFPHSELSSDQEVNRLRARVHQLNMGFSHTMREDGQKRKVVGQESDMPGHRPFGLPENSSSDSPDDGVSELGGKYTGDESQLRVTRGEMIEWVKEVSGPILNLPGLSADIHTDLPKESWKRVTWQHKPRASLRAVSCPIQQVVSVGGDPHQGHTGDCGRLHARRFGIRDSGRGRTMGDIAAHTRIARQERQSRKIRTGKTTRRRETTTDNIQPLLHRQYSEVSTGLPQKLHREGYEGSDGPRVEW